MGRFDRPMRQRRRREPGEPGGVSGAGRPAFPWGAVVAITALLVAVPLLFFNQQHSGDPLKIRRELRKF